MTSRQFVTINTNLAHFRRCENEKCKKMLHIGEQVIKVEEPGEKTKYFHQMCFRTDHKK